MKFIQQIAVFLFVSVFLLQTCSKTIIYVDFELNRGFIAKNLCENKNKPQLNCNGKCHLKKQFDKEEKREQSPASPVKEKYEIQLFSEINADTNLFNTSVTNSLTSDYSFSLSDKHLHSVFHPPKV